MKYRLLTLSELEILKDDFVKYLVLNGIPADEWQLIKEKKPDEAEKIVDLFSDVVFERVFQKANYIDVVSPKLLESYHFLTNGYVRVGVTLNKESSIDFSIEDFYSKIKNDHNLDIKIFHESKEYIRQRELLMFEIIMNGGEISDGTLYKQLCLGL